MAQRNLLRNFEYKGYHVTGVLDGQHEKFRGAPELPLLEVKVDFAKGKMSLQADMKCILHFSRHLEPRYLLSYKKRLKMDMNFLSFDAIDLNDDLSDHQMFVLEGSISDENTLNGGNGMLVLKKALHKKQGIVWRLVFYIYDHSAEIGEMKFDLPLYLVKTFEMN